MKKNISINISGIIFHIEEDGYDTLKKYLDSINKYFSSFDDSTEILADIETRIAEILLSKLNEGKQVITVADVTAVMATMGSVSDFKAAEDTGESRSAQDEQKVEAATGEENTDASPKLHRDVKRKILGGVCAGLGNYLNIDPVWIRLLFVFLTAAYGITLLIYIVMWIIVPGSYNLDEPRINKKMFRDRDHKVLSGVAAGVAAYFGVDRVLIRVLFVVFSVFGGIVIYIVLLIVLPEAKTITDKMQMQGEPVTLSNIAANIKKNIGPEDGKENLLIKILLFPFRLLAALFTALGKVLGPVAEVLRVAIGIFISLIGLALVTGLIFAIIGVFAYRGELQFPLDAMRNVIPVYTGIAALITAVIPGIIILLLGISIMARKIVFSATVGWGLFVLFIVSGIVLAFTIPKIVLQFQEEGTYKETEIFNQGDKTTIIRLHDTGLEHYHEASLTLEGYSGKDFKLEKRFGSQGRSRADAVQNARMVEYHVVQNDSVLLFDSNITFPPAAVFRGQRLDMTLYIPFNHTFVLDDDAWRLINYYLTDEERNGQTWQFVGNAMKCMTCPEPVAGEDDNHDQPSTFSGFDRLDLSGLFNVKIQQGENYDVRIEGEGRGKSKYEINQNGETLLIRYRDHNNFWKNDWLPSDNVHITIVMPHLKELDVKGAGDINFTGFNEQSVHIEGTGAVKMKGDLNAEELDVDLTGASRLDLNGHGTSLDATIQGASQLFAYDYETENAYVRANGASHADVYVKGSIEIEQSIASGVSYRGNPSKVKKE